jgi:DNA-binding winged helix-turn-helix (wHTH) protein
VKIRFDPFTLDLDTRQLTRGTREIRISPKALELLRILVEERPKVLSKEALQERLWPGTFVVEANLSNLVAELRRALGDRRRGARFIRTAHGFGYAFSAEAKTLSGSGRDSGRPRCWIEWGTRRFPLIEGIHTVGRDPDVEVRLDAATVSRRHARITVATGGNVIEDLGSKNGTFVADERLTSPASLADGDEIRFGSVLVAFRARGPISSTETALRSV